METEHQTFNFNFPDPSFITYFPQQSYMTASDSLQGQQDYQIERSSINEFEVINDEQDMVEDSSDMYPSGLSEIDPEAMIFINQLANEEKLNQMNNSTLNTLKSTADNTHTSTADSDEVKSQTTTQGKVQNENRNSPMLITKHAARSLKKLLKGNLERAPYHWQYLVNILEAAGFTKQHIPSFLQFLKSLKSSKKTWEGVKEILQCKGDYARLLLNCIDGLLSEEGQDDFDKWVYGGQVKEKGRNALIEYKEANRENFRVKILPCLS